MVVGLAAVIFVRALHLAGELFLGRLAGYTVPAPINEGELLVSAVFARPWALPLIVGLGGLLSGLLVERLAPEAAGGGIDAAVTGVHRHPLALRARTSLVKIAASALLIGSGGSGGREGPAAQISAGLAAFVARSFRLGEDDARIVVTAGMGAVFRAPLAGSLVSAEILYRRDIETAAIVPGFVTSIIAFAVFGAFQGFAPIFGAYELAAFDQPLQLLYYALIGVVTALAGLLYSWTFWSVRRLFERAPLPRWVRPALGGVLVGCLALLVPQVLGTGLGWMQLLTRDTVLLGLPLWLVLLLPAAKILASSLSVGSGGAGGLFGPGMVIGAFAGAAVWRVLDGLLPGVPLTPAPFVIVGAMACIGSIGHIPIATMLMVAEMTGSLSLLAPALVAVGIATLIVGDRSIFAAQVHSRASEPAHRFRFGLLPVGATPLAGLIREPELVFGDGDRAVAAAARLRAAGLTAAPVTSPAGQYVGVLTVAAGDAAGAGTARAAASASGPVVAADQCLDTAIELLALARVTWAPVVDAEGRLLGVLRADELLTHYAQLAETGAQALQTVAEGAILIKGELSPDADVEGKTLAEAGLAERALVLSIGREGGSLPATPETVVHAGDELLVAIDAGRLDEIGRLFLPVDAGA